MSEITANSWPRLRRLRLQLGECKFCDEMRAEGTSFHPPHDASSHCKSGKPAHCTCDVCW